MDPSLKDQLLLFINYSLFLYFLSLHSEKLLAAGDWIQWQNKRMQQSSSLMNTSHIHVEKSSLKTGDRRKDSWTNKAVRKNHKESVGRENKWPLGWDLGLWERTEGRLHGWRSSLASEWFEPHVGLPIPGVQHQEGESLQVVWKPAGLTGLQET